MAEGVESRSDGVHRIHWIRIDSDGKVHFSIRKILGKIPLMLDEGIESRSDGVHRIHWTRIDSDGKVHFSLCERLVMIPLMLDGFHSCYMRGWKVVAMESIGSIGHE